MKLFYSESVSGPIIEDDDDFGVDDDTPVDSDPTTGSAASSAQ